MDLSVGDRDRDKGLLGSLKLRGVQAKRERGLFEPAQRASSAAASPKRRAVCFSVPSSPLSLSLDRASAHCKESI